ncbi:MAG: OmpA family protein [Rhodoferax sp.]|nr:OmpA family protein [Rhodoferax sp.]
MTHNNTSWAGTSSKLTLVALAAMATPLAFAQIPGPYIGISAGQTQATIDNKNISAGLAGQGFTTTGMSNSDKDSGYKVFGGYQFGKHFAVEGGYFDLGKFGYTATTMPAGTMNGTIKLRGLNLDLVGILPISDSFSLSARVGTNYAEASDTFSGSGAVNVPMNSTNKSEANLKLGLGAQWDFSPSWGVRGELERYRINDAIGSHGDIDMASIGLVYRFGKPARVQVAAAPAYVAPPPPPPPPAPVYVAPPPPPPPPVVMAPPPPRRVSFASDSLFDFDKSDVKAAGADAIDKFARDLNGVSYDMIVVTGHSDRIGSSAYNQKLSERRANAVRNYLVDKAGIPASKISAQGVGESAPVTKTEDCKGNAKTKALIQCLQPDRRVDLEVTGSK